MSSRKHAATIYVVNPVTRDEFEIKNEAELESGEIKFKIDLKLLKVNFQSLGKMVFEIRSKDLPAYPVSPLPDLPDDIIAKILESRVNNTYTGLSQMSGISKRWTKELNKSLTHSPSGNIDMFIEAHGIKWTMKTLYAVPMLKTHMYFLTQLQVMVQSLMTDGVWDFDERHTYGSKARDAPPVIPSDLSSPDVLQWEKAWVYARLLEYIGSNGRYFKYALELYKLRHVSAQNAEKSCNVVDVFKSMDKIGPDTNLFEIYSRLKEIPFLCKTRFPIWKMHTVEYKALHKTVGYGQIFVDRMKTTFMSEWDS